MDEHGQDFQDQPFDETNPPAGDRVPEEAGTIPEVQPLEAEPPARKFKLTWQLALGFLGWFLVNGVLWLIILDGGKFISDEEGAIFSNGICIFPLNLAILFGFYWNKRTRQVAQGILLALGVNFIISLILSLSTNAVCLIPFFS